MSDQPTPAPVDLSTPPIPANTLAIIDVVNLCPNNVIVRAEDQRSFFINHNAKTFGLLPNASRRFAIDSEVAGARLSALVESELVGTTKVEFTIN
jgi:hypothetical protein